MTKLSSFLPSPSFFASILTTEMLRSAISKTILSAARPAFFKASLRPIIARGYHENVISHYEKPRNVCLGLFQRLEFLI